MDLSFIQRNLRFARKEGLYREYYRANQNNPDPTKRTLKPNSPRSSIKISDLYDYSYNDYSFVDSYDYLYDYSYNDSSYNDYSFVDSYDY